MCVCTRCANGDPLNCEWSHFCGQWTGPNGKDEPVDFPLEQNRNNASLEKQIQETRIMFEDMMSYTDKF